MNLEGKELRNLQLKLLETMEVINKICEKENIKYYMLGGTFIGAVRHKGFIPWDDDIDIAMDRKDYERFLQIIDANLPENFKVDFYDRNSSSMHWLKIRNIDYKIVERYDNIESEQYLFIDIFPFDNVPKSKIKRQIFKIQIYLKAIKLRLARLKYLSEQNNQKFNNKLKRIAVKILSLNIFKNYLNQSKVLKQYDNLISKYKNEETSLIANLCVNHKFSKIYRELFEKSKISEVTEYEFENTKLKGIKNYDYLLAKTFGDYMKLPPEEEQKAKHFVKIVNAKQE